MYASLLDTNAPHLVLFYVLGYIVIASANGVGALAAGIILYAM